MHVLIIPSWYPTALDPIGGSFFREQALALHRRGVKVGIIYPQFSSLKHMAKVSCLWGSSFEIDGGVPLLRAFRVNLFPRMYRLACANWIGTGVSLYTRYVADHGVPDVIHAHSALFAGALAQKLSATQGIPYVITEHSSLYSKVVDGTRAGLAKSAFSQAARRIAVSHPLARLLESKFGGTGSWTIVPNIVDRQFLEIPFEDRPWPECTFLAVSALTKGKGLDLLINAFADAFLADDTCCLRIVGDGPERDKLMRLAEKRGVSSQIQFLGRLPRDAVAMEMAHASIFVHSSWYETFGVVLIEALAAGVPVVSTACGGPEDVVTAIDGCLVQVGDVGALAAAMQRLRWDRSIFLRSELRRRCQSRFGEAAVVSQLLEIYEAANSGWREQPL